MASVLDVRDLTVDIPVEAGTLHAVRGISFSIEKGRTFCIVGESGCGKSMTSLAIMDLLPKGAVRRASALDLNGRSLADLGNRAMADIRGAEMAMIFQEPMTSLNPSFTIGDQLTESLRRHRGTSRREAEARAVSILRTIGITAPESRMSQYPHQLSGGLRQRIMIAMAMMCDPSLIIADEPTTALDVTIQAQILRLLKSLQSEFGTALLLITHDLGIVSRMADDVAVMYAGEIVESGPVEQIFRDPQHPYTRGLIACLPNRERRQGGGRLASIPGTVPSLVGSFTGCAFRERCDLAIEACAEPVVLRSLVPGHAVRCIRAGAVVEETAA
jgi:peptide/nickel transport system ATP-binding protein